MFLIFHFVWRTSYTRQNTKKNVIESLIDYGHWLNRKGGGWYRYIRILGTRICSRRVGERFLSSCIIYRPHGSSCLNDSSILIQILQYWREAARSLTFDFVKCPVWIPRYVSSYSYVDFCRSPEVSALGWKRRSCLYFANCVIRRQSRPPGQICIIRAKPGQRAEAPTNSLVHVPHHPHVLTRRSSGSF